MCQPPAHTVERISSNSGDSANSPLQSLSQVGSHRRVHMSCTVRRQTTCCVPVLCACQTTCCVPVLAFLLCAAPSVASCCVPVPVVVLVAVSPFLVACQTTCCVPVPGQTTCCVPVPVCVPVLVPCAVARQRAVSPFFVFLPVLAVLVVARQRAVSPFLWPFLCLCFLCAFLCVPVLGPRSGALGSPFWGRSGGWELPPNSRWLNLLDRSIQRTG